MNYLVMLQIGYVEDSRNAMLVFVYQPQKEMSMAEIRDQFVTDVTECLTEELDCDTSSCCLQYLENCNSSYKYCPHCGSHLRLVRQQQSGATPERVAGAIRDFAASTVDGSNYAFWYGDMCERGWTLNFVYHASIDKTIFIEAIDAYAEDKDTRKSSVMELFKKG